MGKHDEVGSSGLSGVGEPWLRVSTYPLIDADVAAALVREHPPTLGLESVVLADAAGRVLGEDLVADAPLPSFPSSAVDGYAVRAADAGKTLRVLGESAAGRPFEGTLAPGTAARILTGGVVPDGADCVVMVEDVSLSRDQVTVPSGLRPGTNFHQVGVDLRAGDHILPAGIRLGAAGVGLAPATGRGRLRVFRRPPGALPGTGGLLVDVGEAPRRCPIAHSYR